MSDIKYELKKNEMFMSIVEKAVRKFYLSILKKYKKETIYIISFGISPRVMYEPYECILYVNTEKYYRNRIDKRKDVSQWYYRFCEQEWIYMDVPKEFNLVSSFLTQFFDKIEMYDDLEMDVYDAIAEIFIKLRKENFFEQKDGKEILFTFCSNEGILGEEQIIELVMKANEAIEERQIYLDNMEEFL